MTLPRLAAITAFLLCAGPTIAAEATPRTMALAAGYKAAFLCSGIFTAGQTEAQVTADDLNGIYPEYQPFVANLPAVIDPVGRTVSVRFDARLPPRVAVWRPLVGCTQLPVGGTDASLVPRLTPDFKMPDLAAVDRANWPLGDANATTRLPKRSAVALEAVVAKAFDGRSFGSTNSSATTAVIILKDGRIVAERYRAGYDRHTPQRTWSVAKSLTATLVGRAAQLGRIDITAPAPVPEWRAPGDPRGQITTEQLLRIESGLWSNGPGNRTDAVYLGGATVPETAAAMPLEALPGTRFNYANNDFMLAAYALETKLGQDALGFPFTQLLWPLGMTRTTPETDWRGHFVLSSQVWMTARDLARLALLYARDGVGADGTRLLPAGWVSAATTPSGAQPPPAAKRGYGAGLWLYGAANGLPAGTYAMLGNRGQFAVAVPQRNIIVIRRGFDGTDGTVDPTAFTRDVLAAIPG
ncbi:MAG: serine hydrolase [Sandarakinorhabdus sp.]|nr:serine hydrolase [Sandarakinorhabdus sp.]